MTGFPYELDRDDVIRSVSSEWSEFADDNGADGLAAEVTGRSLWDFIADWETRHLYESLFEKVRGSRRAVKVPFRCDAPELRRFMRLDITPLADDGLLVTGHVLRVEPRERVPLLDPSLPRSGDLLRMCGWCKRIPIDGDWLEVEDAVEQLKLFSGPMPGITHGICPECRAAMDDEIESSD